jgi:peptide/nickel transport system permease protein
MTDLLASAEHQAPEPRGSGRDTLRFLLVKIGGGILSVLLVIVLGFFLFRVLPGDPVTTMTRGQPVGPEQLAALRARLGLDRPLIEQFLSYLGNLTHGDFGESYLFKRPVSEKIGEAIGPTVLLVGTSTILAAVLGLWLGTRSGWRHGSRFDRVNTGVALALWSAPTFWLGLILLLVFAGELGWFPPNGITDASTAPDFLSQAIDTAYHMVLPCITLIAVVYAQYLMVMRSSLLEEMEAEYLTTARAKGLRDDLVLRRHAVPNALLPTVTLIFLQLGMVVSGSVTVETVYSWPGLGKLVYDALQGPDLPLLQGCFIVLAGSVVALNIVAELLYRALDPRVRTS